MHRIDARDLIVTDAVHRNAKVNWKKSELRIKEKISSVLSKSSVIVTQGFLGESPEGKPTTLGREGSDYTGAILAYCLDAAKFTVWKDVNGIYNCDPKVFPKAEKIDFLDYTEAIEMTYYGAKVIHPKTIKPLENKGIPLVVRTYITPEDEGSVISKVGQENYPPIIVRESNQIMLQLSTRDLSFVVEENIAEIFGLLDRFRQKVNVLKNTAVSFIICITDQGKRSEECMDSLAKRFQVEGVRNLELLTIRHSTKGLYAEMTKDRVVHFNDHYGNTIQVIMGCKIS